MLTLARISILALAAAGFAGAACADEPAASSSAPALSAKHVADGWDLAFTAAPDQAHLTVSVDGKPAASDKSAYHLAEPAAGLHNVELDLVGSDGKPVLAGGKPVIEHLIVWAGRSPSGTIEAAKPLDFAITQATASVPPQTVHLTQGDVVAIHCTGDMPMELHLHGYDVKAELSPDAPVTILFVADLAGRFSLEKHGKPERTIAYLEVYPK